MTAFFVRAKKRGECNHFVLGTKKDNMIWCVECEHWIPKHEALTKGLGNGEEEEEE